MAMSLLKSIKFFSVFLTAFLHCSRTHEGAKFHPEIAFVCVGDLATIEAVAISAALYTRAASRALVVASTRRCTLVPCILHVGHGVTGMLCR